jgi:hypothetical protein
MSSAFLLSSLLFIAVFFSSCKNDSEYNSSGSNTEAAGEWVPLSSNIAKSTVALVGDWNEAKVKPYCSGTLVSDSEIFPEPFVLTASHCVKDLAEIFGKKVENSIPTRTLKPNKEHGNLVPTGVVFYDFNASDSEKKALKKNAVVIEFGSLATMMTYSEVNRSADLAVLWIEKKTRSKIKIEEKLRPVKLSRENFSEQVQVSMGKLPNLSNLMPTIQSQVRGSSKQKVKYSESQEFLDSFLDFPKLTIAGYGLGTTTNLEMKENVGTLRKLSAKLVHAENDKYGLFPEKMNEGSCFGDSGGPAFSEVELRLELVAVESYGSVPCLGGMSVRTHAGSHLNWIKEMLEYLQTMENSDLNSLSR